jgi:SNF2 family DNA or RNA helicase
VSYKALTDELLDATLPDLGGDRFKPFHHQKVGTYWGLAEKRNRAAFWWDVGIGKTLGSLLLADEGWGCNRILVVSPHSVTRTWAEEIPKFFGHYEYVNLTGSAQKRQETLLYYRYRSATQE